VAITWTNGPRVNGTNWIRAVHFTEIVNRINKLRALMFLGPDTTLPTFTGNADVWWYPGGIYELRQGIMSIVGGGSASPDAYSMQWLDDSSTLINTTSFFTLLNGGTGWTGGGGDTFIGAVQLNELRKGLELLTHGLWKYTIYFDGGLFSVLPDMPWYGGAVAKNSSGQELRTVGFVNISYPPVGLVNVTARGSSKIWVTGNAACSVEVGAITTALSINGGVSRTWNRTWNSPWGSPGGDFAACGSASLTAGTPASISASTGIQSMISGGPSYQNALIRRTDTGTATITVSATMDIEFDMND
jgi:hypothetical protein